MSALTADYKVEGSEHSAKLFKHELPFVNAQDTDSRSAYLGSLKSSIVALQEEVNVFLTQKMEEDKKLGDANKSGTTNDEKEEENYGEEVVEDD